MSEKDKKPPSKGILKPNDPPTVKEKKSKTSRKSATWDEQNIEETLHPADKEYGHMTIDEPKTPYSWEDSSNPGEDNASLSGQVGTSGIDPYELQKKLKAELQTQKGPKAPDPDEFEAKRKAHYNEYLMMQKAKKLMDEEDGKEGKEGEAKKRKAETDARAETSKGKAEPKKTVSKDAIKKSEGKDTAKRPKK